MAVGNFKIPSLIKYYKEVSSGVFQRLLVQMLEGRGMELFLLKIQVPPEPFRELGN